MSITSDAINAKLVVGYRLKKGEKQVLSKVYINSTFPKTIMIRKKAKKLSFFSLYVENNDNTAMNFSNITVAYTTGSYYKGD